MYLIVGLGNPGDKYRGTRHNIGFEVIEALGKKNFIDINKMKFNAIYGEGRINRKKVILVKPTTYMNRSGEAIAQFMNYYKIPEENLIVICDDIDISFSSIRIRAKGSAGSHNGLKSTIKSIGSSNFPRIRIGVGNKRHPQEDLADFVLSKFTKEEIPYINETVDMTVKAIETFLTEGLDNAMNKYNNRQSTAQD